MEIPPHHGTILDKIAGPAWLQGMDHTTGIHALWVCCMNGHWGSIDNHTIDKSGVVKPSVICPECGWHENVILKDW